MKDVHTQWMENRLKDFHDIQRLVDEASGSEDGETELQQEDLVIGEGGASISDDDKDDNDDDFLEDEDEGVDGAIAPSAASPSTASGSSPPACLACETASKSEAIVPISTDTSVLPTGAAERTSILADFDHMISMARKHNEQRLVRILEISKNDCMKLHRNLDPDLKKALQEEQSRVETAREAMRKVEYEKDCKVKAEKAAKKKADDEKKAKVRNRERIDRNYFQMISTHLVKETCLTTYDNMPRATPPWTQA